MVGLATSTGLIAAEVPQSIEGPAIVIDGDSLEVAGHAVRLWGIDAVELHQTCERGGKPWDCGRAAKRALKTLIGRRVVACKVLTHDSYGRAVSRCRVGAIDLNAWLAEHGWALDYRRYSGGSFAAEQRRAQENQRGIWSGRFESPELWRRSKR